MFKFFKKLRRIVNNYDKQYNLLKSEVTQATELIRARTEVHADIHQRSPNQVIVIGRYKNKDYVQIYDIPQDGFDSLIDHLRKVNRYARPGRFDSPWPAVNAVIERDLCP